MDEQAQAQAQSIDWGAIINNTINSIPGWIALSRNQPVPVPGGQGGSLTLQRGGVSASISPLVLVVGAAVIIFIVWSK
jgi:hypothetical protein